MSSDRRWIRLVRRGYRRPDEDDQRRVCLSADGAARLVDRGEAVYCDPPDSGEEEE
jgi:hypothetical protein